MHDATSLGNLLDGATGDAAALGAPGGVQPLRYRDLRALQRRTVEALNALGLGRGDRVAMVLPTGPELAAAFVAVGAGATAAPLNPAYRAAELEFYLGDLRAKALVVQAGLDSPASGVARRLGIPVLELEPDRARGAGAFGLRPLRPRARAPGRGGPSA
jgi:acyl-CoA synthetase (AMP-forming)/AMP-acid ligase II